jgi:hypothetical protein
MHKICRLGVLALAAAAACGVQAGAVRTDDSTVLRPTGKGWGEVDDTPGAAERAAAGQARVRGHGIVYHGGPVMNSGVNVYYIWYGNWSGNTATTILPALASGLNGSPYFNINTTYSDGTKTNVKNIVALAGQTSDNYSRGTALADTDIQAIVASAIGSGTPDANGVYFVLTSADVNETSGFCTQYCGWHTKGTIKGVTTKYSFVGNPDRCPSSCTNSTPAPNGNVGADGMASIIAHELEESASDPELNAWYDRRGMENADKCAWKFGATYNNGTGIANMNLGGLDFLIQQNWVNAKNATTGANGYCDLAF